MQWSFFSKKEKGKKRAELKSFIYRALLSVSEQWADCMPERPQKDWVFSLQQTLPACGTSLYQKKHFRVNTPNPTAYTVTTVPSSPLECPCLFWWRHERDKYARCQQKRSILVLHSPHTCTDRQIRQICTYAHAHTRTRSLFLFLSHTAVWMWVGSHRDVNRLQIHTGPGLIHWSIFCSAGFKWS